MKINGLILAAGNSSRLGKNKQTIQLEHTTMLGMIENSLARCCAQVIVVLGHDHHNIPTLPNSHVLINNRWQSGIGSSIKAGVNHLAKESDAILIALCDQPMIKPTYYERLVDLYQQSPDRIVCSRYDQTLGVPVVFPSTDFKQLQSLPDHQGAQPLLSQNYKKLIPVDCPDGLFDVDTHDDLNQILKLK